MYHIKLMWISVTFHSVSYQILCGVVPCLSDGDDQNSDDDGGDDCGDITPPTPHLHDPHIKTLATTTTVTPPHQHSHLHDSSQAATSSVTLYQDILHA